MHLLTELEDRSGKQTKHMTKFGSYDQEPNIFPSGTTKLSS